MREISSYLANFGIVYFSYTKCFKDGTHIFLDTHNEWIEHFYLNLYEHGAHHKTFDAYTSGVFLWSSIKDQETFIAAREFCDIDHGISLIDKQMEHCDIFTFASHSGNPQIINFYLNHLDILWRHIFYFKDKGRKLILEANDDRTILPKCITPNSDDILVVDNILPENFLKKYYIALNGEENYLTLPEAICCYRLTQGKSIKEIANLLNISARTVESHISNVKKKFNIPSKRDLTAKILQHTHLNKVFKT